MLKKRGPEPLPPHLKRKHCIGVWLNEVELDDLEVRLGLPGLKDLVMHGDKDVRKGMKRPSEVMRDLILGRRIKLAVPAVNQDVRADLARLGSNINQIARSINERAMDPNSKEVFAGILADIRTTRETVVGLRRIESGESASDGSSLDLDVDINDFKVLG